MIDVELDLANWFTPEQTDAFINIDNLYISIREKLTQIEDCSLLNNLQVETSTLTHQELFVYLKNTYVSYLQNYGIHLDVEHTTLELLIHLYEVVLAVISNDDSLEDYAYNGGISHEDAFMQLFDLVHPEHPDPVTRYEAITSVDSALFDYLHLTSIDTDDTVTDNTVVELTVSLGKLEEVGDVVRRTKAYNKLVNGTFLGASITTYLPHDLQEKEPRNIAANVLIATLASKPTLAEKLDKLIFEAKGYTQQTYPGLKLTETLAELDNYKRYLFIKNT